MKKFLSLLLLGAATLAFNPVHAHGNAEPEHGGILEVIGDMTVELVVGTNGVELYFEADGEEVPSEGMAAKLAISGPKGKSEVVLKPAGENRFEAKGVKIPSGAKVSALLTLKDKQSKVTAHFTIK